jgi:putative glutamine amidotransferase
MTSSPKIGISACFLHPDPERSMYGLNTLHYVEQSTSQWVMSGGALPVMIPDATSSGAVTLADYAHWLDGLVMHGGADVWPGSYGEEPMKPEWQGDRLRDVYEIALVKAFVAAGKPVFGICRGLQLINVAFGGSLYQDIPTQHPNARHHLHEEAFDEHFHALRVVPESRLERLLPGANGFQINSIHHQGVKRLAPGFVVEAHCPDDGVIEAIRGTGKDWVAAVQWHPEFHRPAAGVLDDRPLLRDFLAAALASRAQTATDPV